MMSISNTQLPLDHLFVGHERAKVQVATVWLTMMNKYPTVFAAKRCYFLRSLFTLIVGTIFREPHYTLATSIAHPKVDFVTPDSPGCPLVKTEAASHRFSLVSTCYLLLQGRSGTGHSVERGCSLRCNLESTASRSPYSAVFTAKILVGRGPGSYSSARG